MIQVISIEPNEGGTAVATITPTDDAGVELNIGNLTNPQWQLMRSDGTVVNGRTFAAGAMSSLSVTLTGDDLAIIDAADNKKRYFSFMAQYDSSAGSGLYITAEAEFSIADLIGQPAD